MTAGASVPDRTVRPKPARHHPPVQDFAPGPDFPMNRDGWLFAISIAWLCLLLYAAIFVLFLH
jgi:hypothetical protein